MKLTLRHRLPVVVGAAVVLTAASGAAAFALAAAHTGDAGTDAGNSMPIDDNHSPANEQASPEPGDDNGVDATAEPAEHASAAPATSPTARRGEAEPGDDRGVHATAEPGDD